MSSGKIGAIFVGIVMVVAIIVAAMCTTMVPAGYVAVQYNMNGGILDEVLTQGFHMTSPTIKTTLYSVGLEQSYLTAGDKGDSRSDESFSASSSEGKDIRIDLTFTYQYSLDNVASVFVRFKGQSGEQVRDSFIKPNIVSWTKEVVSQYKVADIIGSRRGEINRALTDYLADKFAPYGITISNVSLINLEVDAETAAAINNKITAQQNAETQAILNQTNIDRANADAQVVVTEAQAQADAMRIQAQARSDSHRMMAENLTGGIIQLEWISRWNGVMPMYTNSDSVWMMMGVGE